MPRLIRVSATELIKFLEKQGFAIDRQKGSHIVLTRQLTVSKQVLTVPNHKELDIGTTKAIYNQCKKYIDEETLDIFFYK